MKKNFIILSLFAAASCSQNEKGQPFKPVTPVCRISLSENKIHKQT
jgi:hypothetical protein